MEIPWKKTSGKSTTEMGRHQEGPLIAAECKRIAEIIGGLEYLEGNC
jgi:hypothetical protein